MRYAIISDVHSNLEAFEKVAGFLKRESPDKIIFLGDIIGYGADPKAVIDILKEMNPLCIAGNHEWGVLDKLPLSWFSDYAREAIVWTKSVLSQKDCSFLSTFKIIHQQEDMVFVHSGIVSPSKFLYLNTIGEAQENFSHLKAKILFIGHTHRAGCFVKNKEKGISYFIPREIEISHNQYIINPGSVGQPRDGIASSSLCIYDSKLEVCKFYRLDYNIKKAADKILKENLPSRLAYRLFVGA